MDEYTIAAAVLLGGSALAMLIGFPLAVMDNPERRRRRKNRHR